MSHLTIFPFDKMSLRRYGLSHRVVVVVLLLNGHGHVGTTLYLDRLRPPKRLISTKYSRYGASNS